MKLLIDDDTWSRARFKLPFSVESTSNSVFKISGIRKEESMVYDPYWQENGAIGTWYISTKYIAEVKLINKKAAQ